MARYHVRIGDQEVEVEVDGSTVRVGERVFIASEERGEIVLRDAVDTAAESAKRSSRFEIDASTDRSRVVLVLRQGLVEVIVESARERLAGSLRQGRRHGGSRELRSPIPGVIRAVHRQAGDVVAPGDTILVLEAMKMANEIRAEEHGRIVDVKVKPGDRVPQGSLLAVIEPDGEQEEEAS